MRGTQKRDKKNHVIVRVKKFNPGQIKYVRQLAVFFYYFFCRPLLVVRCCYIDRAPWWPAGRGGCTAGRWSSPPWGGGISSLLVLEPGPSCCGVWGRLGVWGGCGCGAALWCLIHKAPGGCGVRTRPCLPPGHFLFRSVSWFISPVILGRGSAPVSWS
jgi:hypothetical protein